MPNLPAISYDILQLPPISNRELQVVCVVVYVQVQYQQQHREEVVIVRQLVAIGNDTILPWDKHMHRDTDIPKHITHLTHKQVHMYTLRQRGRHTYTHKHTYTLRLYYNCCSLTTLCLQALSGASQLRSLQSATVFSLTKRVKHQKQVISYWMLLCPLSTMHYLLLFVFYLIEVQLV